MITPAEAVQVQKQINSLGLGDLPAAVYINDASGLPVIAKPSDLVTDGWFIGVFWNNCTWRDIFDAAEMLFAQ